MTIGPLIPGTPTTVTPDVGHAGYTSVQSVAPDGQIKADDLLAVLQVALNVQAHADAKLLSGSPAQMVALTNVAAGWIFEVNSTANLGRFVAYGSNPGYGAPWVYTSTGTSGIYWVSTAVSLLLATNSGSGSIDRGICRIGPMTGFDTGTPNGRIPASVVQNRIVHQSALAYSALFQVNLTSGQTLNPVKVILGSTFNASVGDQVVGSFGPIVARSWASDYAEFSVVLLQDWEMVPDPIVLGRCRIMPISPAPAIMTPTIPFSKTVTTSGSARIQIEAVAGNGVLDLEGMDNTDYLLGNVTVYRP